MKRIRTFHHTMPGRILLSLLGILMVIALLLFTPVGNRMMAPVVETSLTSALSTPITVQEFTLTHNRFRLLFQDDHGNTLSTQGGFSLLTLRMYAHYRLECFQSGGINPISTPMKMEGSLNGGIASFLIQGNANIWSGELLYKAELHRFHLASLDLKISDIAYEPLMHFLEYPSDTDTILTGEISLHGFDRRDIEGDISLTTQTHRLTPTPTSEESSNSFDLKSLLADNEGVVKAFHVNVVADVSLEHAGILEPFIGYPLSTPLELNATLKGDQTFLRFKARTSAAKSDSSITVEIPNLEPSRILLDLRHADVEQAFALFSLPAPIKGKLDGSGEFNTTGGKLELIVMKAVTVPTVLRKEYQITQPLIHFDADVTADITKKGVHYRAAFKSDLSRLEIDNTTAHDQMLRELLKSIP
jgi:hypothetical protein